MLFFFIISFFSFIFFYNSFHSKQLPHWASEITLISPFFLKDLSFFSITNFIKASLVTYKMSFENKLSSRSKVANSDEDYDKCSNSHVCLLDLPDLVLETILEKLSPEGLCEMSNVCSSLRDRCMSDHLWEKHMKRKWGKVIGAAAYRHWQCDVISRKESNFENQINENGLMSYLASILPLALVRSSFGSSEEDAKRKTCPPIDSIMSWYLAIDSGKFWFPAQVYNRENGHVGFMLSCYDAEICYDSKTDTFQARYLPHGRRAVAIETGVTWDRIRAPPVDTAAHDLHQSDCLTELRPGDHVEIQWRRNKEYPYGWWYGIVGHLETCDGNTVYCRCHQSEMAVLEFNQYAPGSRWRTTNISRKNHKEEGNEGDGFYGGIRKLCSNEEISIWKQLWPVDTLE